MKVNASMRTSANYHDHDLESDIPDEKSKKKRKTKREGKRTKSKIVRRERKGHICNRHPFYFQKLFWNILITVSFLFAYRNCY